jgi:hypothetical protein
MIYSVVGTSRVVRDKALVEFSKLGPITQSIYSEQIGALESLIEARSLFGERIIVSCVQLMDGEVGKEEMLRLLPAMEQAENIFIIDEPFGDVHRFNRLSKVSKKILDARVEKVRDMSVFTLCTSFAARDKKNTWINWMNVKDKESGEAIQGALWWKWKDLWQSVKEGKSTKYTLPECERIGAELVRSSIVAHRGERDLMVELERIILSI